MNLKETLCQALELLGADSRAYDFDDHSTIVMSFDDVGDIYLDPQDGDKVWLWGVIEDMSEQVPGALAESILNELIRPVAYWASGAMVLRQDGRVGGLLDHGHAIEANAMAEALQDFHECLMRLRAIR